MLYEVITAMVSCETEAGSPIENISFMMLKSNLNFSKEILTNVFFLMKSQ